MRVVFIALIWSVALRAQLDPSIYKNSQPPPSPLDNAIRLQQIRLQQQQIEYRQQQLDLARRRQAMPPAPQPEVYQSQSAKTEDKGPLETTGFLNGRVWQSLNLTEKVVLIAGLYDGLIYFEARADIAEGPTSAAAHADVQKRFSAPSFTRGEMAKQIDDLYSHPANVNLPIVDVIQAAVAIYHGSTYADVETTMLAPARQVYSAISDSQRQ